MNPNLIFETPPPPHQHSPDTETNNIRQWLKQVKQHPHQWIKHPVPVSRNHASLIRYGIGSYRHVTGFETTTRKTEDTETSKGWLYVKYHGPSTHQQ